MKYLVIGGTGTLGKALIHELLKDRESEISVLSRDELKQQEMKRSDEFSSTRIQYRLGDIRDRDSIRSAFMNVDVVFHFAALKHIDVLEENPEESVRTNILGTMNVADCAEEYGVPHVVFSSTDKAVDPVNVYGMCKGISEKILFGRNSHPFTQYSVFRWGNVWASRGSVIHTFAKTLKSGGYVSLTHADMTRFWIRIEDAARFLLETYHRAPLTEACIPPIKSAPVTDIIRILAEELGVKSYDVKTVGLRRGEKLHESLRSVYSDEPMSSYNYLRYSDDELRSLVREVIPCLS